MTVMSCEGKEGMDMFLQDLKYQGNIAQPKHTPIMVCYHYIPLF